MLEGQKSFYLAVLLYLSAGISQVAQTVLFCIVYIWEIIFNTHIAWSLFHLDGYAKQIKEFPGILSAVF